MKNYIKHILLGLVLVAIGLVVGWFIFSNNHESKNAQSAESKNVKESIWTCAMHPQIQQKEPGLCPICSMELVPLNQSETDLDSTKIVLSDYAMKLANIQTTVVGNSSRSSKSIILQGKLKIDERKVFSLSSHVAGRLEKLYVKFEGKRVSKGSVVAEIYSPELISAQKELLQTLSYKSSNPSLYEAAKNKLKNWKVSEAEINRIESSGKVQNTVRVYSEYSGIISSIKVKEGDHLEKGKVIYEISNLTTLWGVFDAYEKDIQSIKVGDTVKMKAAAFPEKKLSGIVSFIDPFINQKTRVAQIRVDVSNSGGALKPEMFLTGSIQPQKSQTKELLSVPKTAVLWTGNQSIVYVKKNHADGSMFEYRKVLLGQESEDNIEVLDGLINGEEVVTNGSFTIDAAAQLEGKQSMMNQSGPKEHAGHDMHGDTQQLTKEKFIVAGNCSMCKDRIENALKSLPGIAKVNWNVQSKVLSVSFNKEKIELMKIHHAIANVGHDTEKVKAEDEIYEGLMGCCKYERMK